MRGHTFFTQFGLYAMTMSNFVKKFQNVSQSSLSCCIPTSIEWVTFAPHPCQYLVLSDLFYFSHSNNYLVITHCCFILQFPEGKWCWVFFKCFFCICSDFLVMCLFRYFGHFLIWLFVFVVLSFKSSIFWILILYQMYVL